MDFTKDLVARYWLMHENEKKTINDIKLGVEDIPLKCLRCNQSFKIGEWTLNKHWSKCTQPLDQSTKKLEKWKGYVNRALQGFNNALKKHIQSNIVNEAKVKA